MAKKVAQTDELSKNGWLKLKEVTAYAGFAHDVYTRQCLREGKFDAPDAPYKEECKGYSRWRISQKSVDHYLQNRAQRTSGRRFILKMDLANEDAVRAALDQAIGQENYTLALSYKPKEDAEGED